MRFRQNTGTTIGTVMDDARIREQSQTHRASRKRSWDEVATISGQDNAPYSGQLPPVDEIAQRIPSVPHSTSAGPIFSSPYGLDSRSPVLKRTKLEGNGYNTYFPTSLDSNSRIPPRPPPSPSPINSTYNHSKTSIVVESSSPFLQSSRGAPAETPDNPSLCRKCRGLITHDEASDRYNVPDSCESCKNNPEYAWVTQTAANALTQLAETLRSGISSEKRGVIRRPRLYLSASPECPPLSQFGLKQTLDWILGRIDEINSIADDFVKQGPTGTLQWSNKDFFKDGNTPQDGSNNMKRYLDADLEESSRAGSRAVSISDSRAYTRRRSSTNTPSLGEESMTVTRPHLEYKLDGNPPRITFMNPPPPPAPTRQLPSPPGRSLASPTSLSFPSPSTPSFGPTSQAAANLPPPLSLHVSNNNYLPPISTSNLPDTALRDHSASLQHEVSVQKIALSSLQGEHDKLLAAFSRSQLRASALEKKHAVSDNEIISLSEEKLRLQQQVSDLERDVDELSRSRDEFRQAAVQEGSQYVEIVKKATRLEAIASEERKTWNKLKENMERRIESLSGKELERVKNIVSNDTLNSRPIAELATQRIAEGLGIDTPVSSIDLPLELKIESPSETRPRDFVSYQPATQQESVEGLKKEVRRLQARCTEVESALRAVQDDGRSMEGILKALLEKAGSAQLD